LVVVGLLPLLPGQQPRVAPWLLLVRLLLRMLLVRLRAGAMEPTLSVPLVSLGARALQHASGFFQG
jgi:hypothetical protein